jgi:arsenate reductase
MAEGFARSLHPGVITAVSAGIEQHGMNPHTVKVMTEAGVDISGQYSKTIDDVDHEDFDFVITVCDHARETCPVLPGNCRHIHHSFADPAASGDSGNEDAILAVYRKVRDEIQAWVTGLPQELAGR